MEEDPKIEGIRGFLLTYAIIYIIPCVLILVLTEWIFAIDELLPKIISIAGILIVGLIFLKKRIAIKLNIFFIWILPTIIVGVMLYLFTTNLNRIQNVWPITGIIIFCLALIIFLIFKKNYYFQFCFLALWIYNLLTFKIIYTNNDWGISLVYIIYSIALCLTILAIIWTNYFLKSQRVKNTLIN